PHPHAGGERKRCASARTKWTDREAARAAIPASRARVAQALRWDKKGLERHAHPRSRTASATRCTDTRYAPSRWCTLYFTDMSWAAWKAEVIFWSRRRFTSSSS